MPHTNTHTQVLHDTTLIQLLTFCKGPPNTPVAICVSSSSQDTPSPQRPLSPSFTSSRRAQDSTDSKLASPSAASAASLVLPGRQEQVPQYQPLAAADKGLVQRDTRSCHEPRSLLLSTQQGTWESGVERNVDWRRDPEAVGEKMRQERRGVRRERGIDYREVAEVNVRHIDRNLRPKTPVEVGVDGFML